jgi:hypothetical protein
LLPDLLAFYLFYLFYLHLGKQEIEAEKQIDYHIAQCVNALAARQEALLRDLHETISKQSTYQPPLSSL